MMAFVVLPNNQSPQGDKEPLMSKKSKKQVRKQVPSSAESGLVPRVRQMLLPMIAGIAATKVDLTSWVYEQGLEALHKLLRTDAEELVGKKGEHREVNRPGFSGDSNS